MDALDLDILRALGLMPFLHGPRPLDATRPSHVARRLQVSPDLVKDRIDRLAEAGIIRGYEIHPNLAHLGLRQVTVHVQVPPERKPQALRDVIAVEGVTGLADFVGADLCIELVHRTEGDLARRVQILGALTGARQVHRLYEQPRVRVERDLTRLDWRIVRALRGRARRPLPEVADELGVSARTVKRRMERLADEGSVDILPVVDPSRIPNYIPLGMACFFDGPDRSAAVRDALRHRLLYSWTPPAAELGHIELALYATSTGEIERLRRAAAEVEGVARVDVGLPCGAEFVQGWLNEAIDERIRLLEGVSGTPSAGP